MNFWDVDYCCFAKGHAPLPLQPPKANLGQLSLGSLYRCGQYIEALTQKDTTALDQAVCTLSVHTETAFVVKEN